jgi:phosphoglycolate phosphatase
MQKMTDGSKMKLVIFDFDGTIADSFDEILKIFNELSEKYRHEKIESKAEIDEMKRTGAKQILEKFRLPFYKYAILLIETRKLLKSRMSKIRIFGGVADTVRYLKDNGFMIGILSSNREDNIRIFLKNNGIDIFDIIMRSSLFGKAGHLKKISGKYKIKVNDIIYVGDEVRDIISAKKAGVKIISVTWGFNSKDVLKNNAPDYLVDDISEIHEILIRPT